MSPEELREFQKKQCIFCQIIAGKVQSRKVYEDDSVIAILDVNPANPGHMLIMPKEHYSIMPQMPDEETGHIFAVAKALSNAALRSLEVHGSNIIVANGVAAGQRAQHFMVHLIPRKENDNLSFQVPQKTIEDAELKKIRKVIADSLGAKAEEPVIVPLPKLNREKKVVDAEFNEKKQQKMPKQLKKLEDKRTGKKTKSKAEDDGINLDDIAKVLGGR